MAQQLLAMSDYLENQVLNRWLRNTAGAAPPATIYLGLFTAMTAAQGELGTGGTEVVGNAYARQAIAFNAPDANGVCFNTSLISFPAATPAGWGTIIAVGLFDAAAAGNLLWYVSSAAASPISTLVSVGESVTVAATTFSVSLG